MLWSLDTGSRSPTLELIYLEAMPHMPVMGFPSQSPEDRLVSRSKGPNHGSCFELYLSHFVSDIHKVGNSQIPLSSPCFYTGHS